MATDTRRPALVAALGWSPETNWPAGYYLASTAELERMVAAQAR